MKPSPKKRGRDDEMKERTKLAERLREVREYLGFSQDQVAQYLGISRSALSNIETGQRRVEATELTRLARLYKKPATYFTGDLVPPGEALPPDVEHIAREAAKLTRHDRAQLASFADFLRSQAQRSGGNAEGR